MNKNKLGTPTRKLNYAGIIAAFKVRYRAKVVRPLLEALDETSTVIQIDVKQAMFFIREAWREVSSQTIENCWRKTCSNMSECIEKIREEREQVIDDSILDALNLLKLKASELQESSKKQIDKFFV